VLGKPSRFLSSSANRWKVCHPMPGLASSSSVSCGITFTFFAPASLTGQQNIAAAIRTAIQMMGLVVFMGS